MSGAEPRALPVTGTRSPCSSLAISNSTFFQVEVFGFVRFLRDGSSLDTESTVPA